MKSTARQPSDFERRKSAVAPPDTSYEPADGGWGWCVVAGACVVMMVVPTALTSFGVLVPVISKRFDITMAEVSWVPAIAAATWNFSAPYGAAIVKYYSHRSVAMFGTLLMFSGLFLSAFSDSLFTLYITYGIMGGLGATLAGGVGLFLVQEYFTTNRAKANGITMAGSSIGQMTIPVILQILLDTYEYRGALIIYSGIILQACVAAALYQPSKRHRRRRKILPTEEVLSPNLEEPEAPPTYEPRSRSQSWSHPKGYSSVAQEENSNLNNYYEPLSPKSHLEVVSEELSPESEKNVLGKLEDINHPEINVLHVVPKRSTQRSFSVCSESHRTKSTSSVEILNNVAMMGSVMSLASLPPLHPVLEEVQSTLDDGVDVPVSRKWWVPKCPKLSEMLQFGLLKNPFFLLSTTSAAIGRLVYQEVNVLVPSFGQSIGLSPRLAASLLTILALCDTSARLLVPVLSDRLAPKINRVQVFTSGYLLCSIACLGFSFADSYVTLAVSCGLYGFGVGGNTSLGIVILVENLGLENLTAAFGLSIFLSCFTLLPGVPLIGYIQSVTQSFNLCFLILFCLMSTCVLQWIAMPYVIQWNEAKKSKRNSNTNC